jgi:iron complex transport system permease protein
MTIDKLTALGWRTVLVSSGLALSLLLGLSAGHEWYSLSAIFSALSGADSLDAALLLEWRAPRVLAAALVGALLGACGAVFQGVFRNPLAEPYLLGTAGGGALGAALALLVPFGLPGFLSLLAFSFTGAWGATLIVLLIARAAGRNDPVALLLAGVTVAAILQALRSGLMLALSDDNVSLQTILSWTLGGIQTPSWGGLLTLALLAAGLIFSLQRFSSGLDCLGLGDDYAATLGIDPGSFIRRIVLVAAMAVAVAVAWGGLVAFVGLMAPHVARWAVGPLHARVIPASAVVGAMVTVVCDAIARSALPPGEIPLGLITAVVGGPFFLFILIRRFR